MKILRHRVQQAAKDAGLNQNVVERDYAQSYVLLGLATNDQLKDTLVFKGGTALKKVYFANYRFSEDLDFTMDAGPKGDALEDAVRASIASAEKAARALAPLTFTIERYEERDPHPGSQEAFIVRVQFPWQREPLVPVKIEVTDDEPVLLPAPRRTVAHGYGELLDASIRTYALEEICAEKLRSTRQTQAKLANRGWARSRARDFYDLWHLVREPPERIDWIGIREILPKKCALRDVTLVDIGDVFGPSLLEEVRATWKRTLGPFVRDLPDVERVLTETREGLQAQLKL